MTSWEDPEWLSAVSVHRRAPFGRSCSAGKGEPAPGLRIAGVRSLLLWQSVLLPKGMLSGHKENN